eukprot:Nitzschia sp. Nitz4//scaffold166_size90379//20617//24330//NITZ4_005050-RA/size90379-processed-gene-0.123-mRNA-1//-1//CDS//3329538175//4810//frame0
MFADAAKGEDSLSVPKASPSAKDDPAVDIASSFDSESTPEPEATPQPVTPDSPKVSIPDIPPREIDSTLSNISDEKKASEPDLVEEDQPPSGGVPPELTVVSSKVSKKKATPVPNDASPEHPGRTSSHHKRSSKRRFYDDASSSDDDSYFAKHLPSPKSGRSFSYSSAGSTGAVAPPFYRNNAARESDASLSFSDESDDDFHHQGVQISPSIPPEATVGDMHLFPQRITRMHSVSSLVSSGSSDGPGRQVPPRKMSASSVSSQTTSGSTSDPGVRAELREVTAEIQTAAQGVPSISGRKSPVMGHGGVPGVLYSDSPSMMSPPAIMSYEYNIPQGVPHPKAQPLSQDQMSAWANADGRGMPPVLYNVPQTMGDLGASTFGSPHNFRSVSDSSTIPSVPFVYSEDEEPVDSHFMNRLADRMGPPSLQPPPQGHGMMGQGDLRGRSGAPPPPEGGNGQSRNVLGPTAEGNQTATTKTGEMDTEDDSESDRDFKVYWQRWLMLFYMSVLNLLSDWTCYSVAPISLLTEQALGDIDPERLVVVFLGANAVASICEPIILSRLGFRRTVLFGSLLLMIGSIVKSGGVPPILPSDITMGNAAWRLYLGFFLVGLSQPLYQCTPTLLSSSWFPEEERTMATGVALNANQLGIGFAFVFGTLLVAKKEDIIPYFGLLSTISTIVFLGALIQFDDAPPTPPSSSARVVRGTLDVKLPSINKIVQSVRDVVGPSDDSVEEQKGGYQASRPNRGTEKRSSKKESSTRRRTTSRSSGNTESGLGAPSSAMEGPTRSARSELQRIKEEAASLGLSPPSFALPGQVDSTPSEGQRNEANPQRYDENSYQDPLGFDPRGVPDNGMYPGYPGMPPPASYPPYGSFPPSPYQQYPYWDPQMQQQMPYQPGYYQPQYFYPPQGPPHGPPQGPPPPFVPPHYPQYYPNVPYYPPHLQGYDYYSAGFTAAAGIDEGVEPILTITPHHLDIDIRDDQVIRSLRACFARNGFVHALVAFTASGIVINTLSTYMDYLVRLNGAPRAYTGIVGGTFQFVIMISSLIIGKLTDASRAYYSVSIAMLVLGAFGLAECGVSLDSNKGDDLRWCLVIVAALVGPLQPVSTELGVDVVYPLSENTVLVIQQLFSNLLSAMFIPIFKSLKDVGSQQAEGSELLERPQYTFSFYLLIVIHTTATVFFATFNGKYLRYEHELQIKAEKELRDAKIQEKREATHPFFRDQDTYGPSGNDERQPLVANVVV